MGGGALPSPIRGEGAQWQHSADEGSGCIVSGRIICVAQNFLPERSRNKFGMTK